MPEFLLALIIWWVFAEHPVPSALCPGAGAAQVNLPLGDPPPPLRSQTCWISLSGFSAACARRCPSRWETSSPATTRRRRRRRRSLSSSRQASCLRSTSCRRCRRRRHLRLSLSLSCLIQTRKPLVSGLQSANFWGARKTSWRKGAYSIEKGSGEQNLKCTGPRGELFPYTHPFIPSASI